MLGHGENHIYSKLALLYLGCGCWGIVWGWRCPAGWVWPGPPPGPGPCSRPPPPCPRTPTAPSAPAQTPGGEREAQENNHKLEFCFFFRTKGRKRQFYFWMNVWVSHYIFRGLVDALGRSADGVRGRSSLLLLVSRGLGGALRGALFTDGVLEARDGHVICKNTWR